MKLTKPITIGLRLMTPEQRRAYQAQKQREYYQRQRERIEPRENRTSAEFYDMIPAMGVSLRSATPQRGGPASTLDASRPATLKGNHDRSESD